MKDSRRSGLQIVLALQAPEHCQQCAPRSTSFWTGGHRIDCCSWWEEQALCNLVDHL